jgi:hypothetical protein
MKAMMQMKKLDIAGLEKAYRGDLRLSRIVDKDELA